MEFKIWLENIEAKRNGIKDTILQFLRDKLNIRSDSAILSMSLGSIDKKVISDLSERGLISSADGDVLDDIRNGSITVQQLIDRLAGVSSNSLTLNQPSSQNPSAVV